MATKYEQLRDKLISQGVPVDEAKRRAAKEVADQRTADEPPQQRTPATLAPPKPKVKKRGKLFPS